MAPGPSEGEGNAADMLAKARNAAKTFISLMMDDTGSREDIYQHGVKFKP